MSIYTTKNVNGVDIPLTPEEIAELEAKDLEWESGAVSRQWDIVRKDRDQRLADCDFRVLPDYPNSDVASWETYRQALRDVPSQPDPFNITWPQEPA